MAKRYNLRLQQELEKAVRNFNAKIRRLEKQERDLILPEKLNYFEVSRQARTKRELEQKIEEIKRFSERGVEETITTKAGVDISKYELQNLRRESKRIKQRLTREIHKLEKITPTSLGVKQDFTLKTIPSERLINLKRRRESLEKDIDILSGEEFTYYLQKINSNKRRSRYRDLLYQENYSEKILLNLGYQIGYDKNKLDEIKKKLSTLSTNDFLRLMDTEKLVEDIQYYYNEVEEKISRQKNISMNSINDIYSRFDMLYDNLDKIIENYK